MYNARNSTQTLNYLASIHYASGLGDVGALCRLLKTQCGLSGMMIQRVHFDGEKFNHISCRCFGAYLYFRSEYLDQALVTHDPILSTGLELGIEFDWDKANSLGKFSNSSPWYRAKLNQYGLGAGLSSVQRSDTNPANLLSVHLAVNESALNEEQIDIFENIIPYFMRMAENDWVIDGPQITVRQLEIAGCLQRGLSPRQVATSLNLPVRAINFHINRISETLKAENIDQALEILDSHCLF